MRYKLLCLFLTANCAGFSTAKAIELSIYSNAAPGSFSPDLYRSSPNNPLSNEPLPGYAFVTEQRELSFKAGHNEICYANIPSFLDPTTIQFRSLTDPLGTEIIQQEYRFDLANSQVLLNNSIGKEITVEQSNGSDIGSFSGKLLNTSNGIMIQNKNNQIITLNNYSAIRFPSPNPNNDFFNTPTLLWKISAKQEGSHKTETRYQTKEITWWADYNSIFEESNDPNQGTLELSSWVSVMNRTGMNFDNAKLKLVAGDVNVSQPNFRPRSNMMLSKMVGGMPQPQFSENSIFEYHVYSLKDNIFLPNNSTKQIQFMPKLKKIPVEKQYIYESTAGLFYAGYTNTEKDVNLNANTKVDVYLKWVNDEKSGLGIALPAGRVRISAIPQHDANKMPASPEFIGEDIIDHTAKDEEIQVKMGSAFDLAASRKQSNFSLDANRHIMEESFEITIKNHKEQAVKVIVKENLYRAANWEILEGATPYEKLNSGTVRFPVTIPKNGEAKVTYTVRYSW